MAVVVEVPVAVLVVMMLVVVVVEVLGSVVMGSGGDGDGGGSRPVGLWWQAGGLGFFIFSKFFVEIHHSKRHRCVMGATYGSRQRALCRQDCAESPPLPRTSSAKLVPRGKIPLP